MCISTDSNFMRLESVHKLDNLGTFGFSVQNLKFATAPVRVN